MLTSKVIMFYRLGREDLLWQEVVLCGPSNYVWYFFCLYPYYWLQNFLLYKYVIFLLRMSSRTRNRPLAQTITSRNNQESLGYNHWQNELEHIHKRMTFHNLLYLLHEMLWEAIENKSLTFRGGGWRMWAECLKIC